ncbi:hypothetical protein L6452_24744 [Arctium lappa]|uniref:Uncharacterized protein n=1 Tax=Arctium lappa TaxID=4217 RepID=A0ACB9AAX0_ARCLA|nr:hypothetical protein L6452_24744 [Arctium lappa]
MYEYQTMDDNHDNSDLKKVEDYVVSKIFKRDDSGHPQGSSSGQSIVPTFSIPEPLLPHQPNFTFLQSVVTSFGNSDVFTYPLPLSSITNRITFLRAATVRA